MLCDCSTSTYCYEPVGRVITGDLQVIRDAKLRSLVARGPSYREQNPIHWKVNEGICRQAVSACKRKWSNREGVDLHVLKHKVKECILR